MKSKVLLAVLFVSIFAVKAAQAQNKYYLSQVANGNYGAGSYKMTFVLFNNTDTDTTATLTLTDDGGNPLVLTLAGKTNSTFTIQLPAGSSQILQSDGQGNLVVGAATVTCAVSIGVSAIFSIFDADGNYLAETGVGNSDPLSSFVLPVDTTGLFNTGLALFNFGTGSVSITLTLRGTDGQQVGSVVPINLQAQNHLAHFISGAGQFFPSVSNFQGTLLVQCSAPIAALVLRQNSSTISFTSLPAVSTLSTKLSLKLPQVANGTFGGGSYKTSFLIFNISASPASVGLTLTDDNGNPFSVTIPGRGTSSTFSFNNLAPGASLFLQTDGTGGLSSGAAVITSTVPVGASGIFTVFDSKGAFQTETGVGDSPVLSSLTLPVDIVGNFDTGVAFYAAAGTDATLTFQLLDSSGALYGSPVTRPLANKGHLALFVSQLFSLTSSFKGSLAVTSTSGVAAVVLRQNASPLSYTTLPVASGISKGKTVSTTGRVLGKIEMGVNITSNITKDEVLQAGFKLTGTVSGPGRGRGVTATSVSDITVSYSGTVNAQTGAYTVLLPSGTYTLAVGFTPSGAPSGETLVVRFTVPGSVVVSGDTTRDITLPQITLYTVSGTVSGLNNLPLASSSTASATATISFTSSTAPTLDASMDVNKSTGSYQGMLPMNSYTVSFTGTWISTSFQIGALTLTDLGTASVNGNTTLSPFIIPTTAKLSGTMHGLGVPPIGEGGIVLGLNQAVTISGYSLTDPLTNQYQVVLPKNITYIVSAAVTLIQGTVPEGTLSFPLVGPSVNLGGDTANFDFTVPALPAQVTISGHVTDSGGKPVANASISATSNAITGGQIGQFTNSGQADANGFYSLTVLSGTAYTVTYTPVTQ